MDAAVQKQRHKGREISLSQDDNHNKILWLSVFISTEQFSFFISLYQNFIFIHPFTA